MLFYLRIFMRTLLISLLTYLLLALPPLYSDDAPPILTPTPAVIDAAAVPSLVNLTSMPTAVVNGCVNVISGDLCESDEEDVIYSPDPYVLGHTYFSSSLDEGNLGAGWNFLHYHLIEVYQPNRISYTKDSHISVPYLLPLDVINIFEKDSHPCINDRPERDFHNRSARHGKNYDDNNKDKKGHIDGPEPLFLSLYDPAGGRILYKTMYDERHKERSLRHFALESNLTGYTNVVGGSMSGKSNLKNIKVQWDKKKDAFEVVLGDGTKRLYKRQCSNKEMKKTDKTRSKNYRDYQLEKEIKPNGNIVGYKYNDKHEIVHIEAHNHNYSHKLYEVAFNQRTTGDFAKHPNLTVSTSDNRAHTYFFTKLDGSYMHGTYSVSHIRRQGHPFTNYVYSQQSPRHKRRVVKKETEDGYYVSTKYYRRAENWMNSRQVTPKDKKEREFLNNRVRMQLAPVGPNGQEVITHRYFYYMDNEPSGHATVRDVYNNTSRYYWNKDKRLVSVTKNDNQNTRLMCEKYYWGENGTDDEGRLLSYVLQDENNKPILARTYAYDARGNVTAESLYGAISENSENLQVEDGKPQDVGCSIQTTRYTYTDDGFNLVKSSCDPLGNYTYYEYKKGTNLVIAKFCCEGTHIKRREFFDYDDSALQILHIMDDGNTKDINNLEKATERHITKTKPRAIRPRLGEPEEIVEFFYNFAEKKQSFLKKTVNYFNDKGFVVKRELVDQLGNSLFYEFNYDDAGRIVFTKDPLGQSEHIEYDISGRIIKKTGPRDDISYYYEYDVAGRLIKETEKQPNLDLVTSYEYDLLSRKTAIKDPQGNTTRYEYDALNRITAIIYPSIYDHKGKEIVPKKTYSYKNLGTQVTETDENGLKTKTTYNALGKVCKKVLPNKTTNAYYYDLKGNLVKEISPNGACNCIEYDAFNRIKRSRLMMQDEVLCKNEIVYNSFHPILEIGPTGEKTAYEYDFAGRKIAVTLQDTRVTKYVYDAKERLLRERTFLSPNEFIGKSYKYDALNRVIYEAFRDDKKRVRTYKSYGYDVDGNISSITQNIEDSPSTSISTFLPHGMASSVTDAQGNITKYTYDYHFQNMHGQTVVRKITTNAIGARQEEIYDTRGNLSQVLCYDPQDTVISKKKLFYDAANICIRTNEYAMKEGKTTKKVITLFEYFNGQLIAITEAAREPEEKVTRFSYNDFGQKEKTTFSDGSHLSYTYDAKGRVDRFFGNTIDYTYTYDASDRILVSRNNLTNQQTTRTYNAFGELHSETLETGMAFSYSYDNAGRPTCLKLPDSSKVIYEYSCFLEKITRQDAHENNQYSHSILKRDLSGLVKSCELANTQKISYTHDKLGRLTNIRQKQFSQKAQKFDAVGNLLALHAKDLDGQYDKTFSYDFLSQLTSEDEHTYSYDSLHNRLSHNNNVYDVNSLHSVLSDNTRSFHYDLRGNRISMLDDACQTRYKYDALDRLV